MTDDKDRLVADDPKGPEFVEAPSMSTGGLPVEVEFVDPFRIRTESRRYDNRLLYTCSVCAALVEEDYMAAHEGWHNPLPCTCGFGGQHDPDNPRCERNQA